MSAYMSPIMRDAVNEIKQEYQAEIEKSRAYATGLNLHIEKMDAEMSALRAELAAARRELELTQKKLSRITNETSHPFGGSMSWRECVKCDNPYPEWTAMSSMTCPACKLAAAQSALAAEQQAHAETRGAMSAQDEREKQAAEKCGVPYELSGCDWPDAVADAVIELLAKNRFMKMMNEIEKALRIVVAEDRDMHRRHSAKWQAIARELRTLGYSEQWKRAERYKARAKTLLCQLWHMRQKIKYLEVEIDDLED